MGGICSRIRGTHLCENDGRTNDSRPPGTYFDWDALTGALAAAGYEGSWDLEIICPPDEAATVYDESAKFLFEMYTKHVIQNNGVLKW